MPARKPKEDMRCASPCHELALAAYPDLNRFVYKPDNSSQVKLYMRNRLQAFADDNGIEFQYLSPLCKPCIQFSKNELAGTAAAVRKQEAGNGTPSPSLPSTVGAKRTAASGDSTATPTRSAGKSRPKKSVTNRIKLNGSSTSANDMEVGRGSDEDLHSNVLKQEDSPLRSKLLPPRSERQHKVSQSVPSQSQKRPKEKGIGSTSKDYVQREEMLEGCKLKVLKKKVEEDGTIWYLVHTSMEKIDGSSPSLRLSAKWEPENAVPEHLIEVFARRQRLSDQFDRMKSDLKRSETLPGFAERLQLAHKNNLKDDFISIVTNFDGKIVEEIVSIVSNEDKRFFLVKFVEIEKLKLVKQADANRYYPQEVIGYYQSRIKWSSPVPLSSRPPSSPLKEGNCNSSVASTDDNDTILICYDD